MVNWPAGHRWEDYQVKLYDKTFSPLGALASVYNLKGKTTRWGQYGGNLTFSLEQNDPWVAILKEKELHAVNVLRDGTSIWGGYQTSMSRDHDKRKPGEESWVEFEFLPLARMLYWRWGYESSEDFLKITGVTVDDAFKDIVEKTLGASAPNTPTTGLTRVLSALAIAADKSEHPSSPDLDANAQNIYEFLQERGVSLGVDWDVYWDGDTPTFETWYPQRGVDRTEGNGSNTECIFNDTDGNIVAQSYGWDTGDAVTVVLSANLGADVAASTTARTNWLIRERAVDSHATQDLELERENYAPQIWYKMDEFRETPDKKWLTHFNLGDKCTWISHHFGYGPHDDIIGAIEFEIDKDGFEHLNLILGDDPPTFTNKVRGGGGRARRTRYSKPPMGAWNLRDDTGDRAYPDSDESIGIAGSQGLSTTAGTNLLTLVLNDTAVVAGTYGDATHSSQIVVNAQGRLTGASDVLITGVTPSAHNLLSAQHGDTVASTMTRGDLIVGTAGGWDDLAIGAANTVLKSDGTDLAWDTLLGIPAQSSPGADRIMFWDNSEGTTQWLQIGTGLDITTNVLTATAHNLLSGQHGDTVASAMTRGDLVVGTVGGWDDLAIGANGTFLSSDGTDASWRALAAGDIEGLSDPGTCTVATSNAAGTPHTHAITTASAPGAAAAILASDANGYVRPERLELGAATRYIGYTATNVLVTAAGNLYVDPGGGAQRYILGQVNFRVDIGGPLNLGNAAKPWGDLYIGSAKGIIHADGVAAGQYLRGNATRYVPSTIQAGDLPDLSGTYVPVTRTVTAGTGLTGGGALSADITLNVVGGTGLTANADNIVLDDTAVVPGTYGAEAFIPEITIDQQGRITAAANISIGGTYVPQTTQVIAGDGLTDGGALSGDVTVTMGTPSTLGTATTNNVTATSHTHAINETADGDLNKNTILKTSVAGHLKTTSFSTSGQIASGTDILVGTSLAVTTTITAGTGLTVTTGNLAVSSGNITVSGTVDGVDIATFKAAYDGHVHGLSGSIATGAADYTYVGGTNHAHYWPATTVIKYTSTDSGHNHTVTINVNEEWTTNDGDHNHPAATYPWSNTQTGTPIEE